MFGASGYDAGASQFAGGGFMPSQANDKFDTTQGQQKRSLNNQTLRAVTVNQLVKNLADTDDETFVVDGIELNNVTIVGQVISVEDNNTRMVLTVDDGTGTVEVMQWKNGDDSDWVFAQRKQEWETSVYVRVYGHMRCFERKKSIMAYNIRTIRDYNEITHHFVSVVFQHLHLTRGAPPALQQHQVPQNGVGGHAGGGWAGQAATPYSAPGVVASMPPAASVAGAGAGAAAGALGALTPIHRDVVQSCTLPDSHMGLSVEQITNQLGRYGIGAVQQAVEFLLSEGHLYNTVDDEHFKAAV